MKIKFSNVLSMAGLIFLTMSICGCNEDLVITNPLPSIKDSRINGVWAGDDGKLAFLIKSDTQGYSVQTADDLKSNQQPISIYLATIGGMTFAERSTPCTDHYFAAPRPEEAPQGCWSIWRVVLGDKTLDYYSIDLNAMVKNAQSGGLRGIAYNYGVHAEKNEESPSVSVLLRGTSNEIEAFLTSYAKGSIYASPQKYHRID